MKHGLLKKFLSDGFLNNGLRYLFLDYTLYIFSTSLLHLFLPLYLIQELAFPLWLALMPSAVLMACYGIFSFFGYKIQSKIGTKKMFILSYFTKLIHHGFLLLIPFNIIGFWLYLAFAPINAVFAIWQPHQISLSKYTNKKHRGLQLSFLSVVVLIAYTIGPILGAWVLSYYGFIWLIAVQYIFMGFRIFPILKLDNFYEPKMKWSYREVMKLIFSKRFRKTFISLSALNVLNVGNLLWPIFIFLSLKTYLGVGSVLSIAIFFQLIFTLFVGRITDIFKRKSVLVVGTVLNSLSWFGRFIINFLPKSILLFTGLETYSGFVGQTTGLPYNASVYDKLDKNLDYRPMFDIMEHISKVSTLFLVILILYLFPTFEKYIYVYFLICAVVIFLLPMICNHEK
ncbi:MAG: MFS transporter [Nanoarchaeota archaeon]|nr:MFS transporter [Nanoarchaeota archaeon]